MSFTIQDMMLTAETRYEMKFLAGKNGWSNSISWTKLAKALNIFQKKPYIEPDKCIRCGICVNSCPVPGKAVDFRNDKNNPPVYDYKKCIRCFCCQEMCPKKAIKVK